MHGPEIPYRMLGRTGERVSAIGLGGYHLGKPHLEASESLRIIRTAIDNVVSDGHDRRPGQADRGTADRRIAVEATDRSISTAV